MDLVLAIDFGGTKVAVAAATLDGELGERVRFEVEGGAEQVVARALAVARETVARAGGRCVAAGVVCPGIPREDRVLLAPNVPGWESLALARRVREGLGLERVTVGNDVKAAGLAEARWGTLAGADPGVFLSLGTGVAAAVIAGGRVLAGAHGAAGELGYTLRSGDEPAFADGHAPLEEIAGGRFIGERASELLGREASAADAFAAEDGRVRDLVDRTLDELAINVANLAIVVDPQRIAVGGGMMGSGERVLAALRRRLERAVPFPPELVPARFVHDAALRGAVALALDAASPQGDDQPGRTSPDS